MFDIVIQDSVGFPYAGDTVSGIGGSEHFVIKLARALAKCGLRVMVRNNTLSGPAVFDGVEYQSCHRPEEIECKTLLLQRVTPLPMNVGFDRLVVQVHDAYPGSHDMSALFQRLKATLVCNSNWQRSKYPAEWNSVIIPPMLHQLPPPAVEKELNSFIFASAALKGFEQTINKWRAYRKIYGQLKNARLHVISSGYDMPKTIADPSIVYVGTLNDEELWTYLNRCAGMFYVNAFEETFGVTAAIAEQLGTRTHILCLNGFGALHETISDHRFLTNDHDQFRHAFLDTYGLDNRQISTRDYNPQTTLAKWRAVLKLE